MNRYKAIFSNGSTFALFGESYFADKAVFWRHHQAHLIQFRQQVCLFGRPEAIFDNDQNLKIPFPDPGAFDVWFSNHQSANIDFGFSDLDQLDAARSACLNRIEKMTGLLRIEWKLLNSHKFDPWRIDGGYKELECLASLGDLSLEILYRDHPGWSGDPQLAVAKACFQFPLSENGRHPALINYSKLPHQELDPNLLKRLVMFNLEGLNDHLKSLWE